MRVQAEYIVRGNSEMSKLARKNDIFEIFNEPMAIQSPEGGCRDPWSRDDYLKRAKLFYLMHIYDEYSHNEELSKFFPKDGLNLDFFDKFWEIFQVEAQEIMPAHGERFKGADKLKRSEIMPTGNELIENWLNDIIGF